MNRCRSCRSWVMPETATCPVCGNDPDAAGKELSSTERRVRRAARGIRITAMFHLTGAGLGYAMLPKIAHPYATLVISTISLILAVGLIRFDYRAYKLAVVCYFAYGMVNVISIQYGAVHLAGIALALITIYLVGNKNAKAIFERRLPEDE